MYKDLQQIVPTQKRAEINDKILYCIDTHNKAVTSEVVYNCYTGAGGLHNLSFMRISSWLSDSKIKN